MTNVCCEEVKSMAPNKNDQFFRDEKVLKLRSKIGHCLLLSYPLATSSGRNTNENIEQFGMFKFGSFNRNPLGMLIFFSGYFH